MQAPIPLLLFCVERSVLTIHDIEDICGYLLYTVTAHKSVWAPWWQVLLLSNWDQISSHVISWTDHSRDKVSFDAYSLKWVCPHSQTRWCWHHMYSEYKYIALTLKNSNDFTYWLEFNTRARRTWRSWRTNDEAWAWAWAWNYTVIVKGGSVLIILTQPIVI